MPKNKNKISKTAYVLALPADLPVAAVVEKAKKDGIKITPQYVYNIRAAAGKGKKAKKAKAAKLPRAAEPAAPKTSTFSALQGSGESTFMELVLNIGVIRARELLNSASQLIHNQDA